MGFVVPLVDLHSDDALLVVDCQNDFFPGGTLAVPAGDEILPVVNRLMAACDAAGGTVVLTRDWHPAGHCSFEAEGGTWPEHCVHGTAGADFHPGLRPPPVAMIVHKATTRDREAYSGFDGTDLAARLRQCGVRRLVVAGLALDYCVKATVVGGIEAGFEAVLVLDGTRAVNANPGDGAAAIEAMRTAGAQVIERGA